MRIAIQPDYVRQRNGEEQSFSTRWKELARRNGIEVLDVNVYAPDIVSQVEPCDAFMWRVGIPTVERNLARRLLPAIAQGLNLPVFPDSQTLWHFEDKIAQSYLLKAANIRTPHSRVFWSADEARRFCRTAAYPVVAKLSFSFQSRSVVLLHASREAEQLIDRMFGTGLSSLTRIPPRWRHRLRRPEGALRLLLNRQSWDTDPGNLEHGYLYLQEFVPGNQFDTRVTVIGDRAFAFRRFNRPGDFRASGSGRIDWNPEEIDLATVRLAFTVARRLQAQSIAIDGLRDGEERVVCEINYAYAAWAVRNCPGHWVLDGEPEAGALTWIDGHLRPEDAIFDDFVARLRHVSR